MASSQTPDLFLSHPTGGCALACQEQFSNMVVYEGCCTTTVAMAEARWNANVMSHPMLGRWFQIDWGGGSIEEFRAPDPCGRIGGWVEVECLARQCISGGVWPAMCCDTATAACANGGVQGEPGACLCKCPNGWTGQRCEGRAPHLRMSLRLTGSTRHAWVLGGAGVFRALLASKLAVVQSAVEFDGAPEETVRGRSASVTNSTANSATVRGWEGRRSEGYITSLREYTASGATSSLQVDLRVIVASNGEVLRVKKATTFLLSSQVIFHIYTLSCP
jgi:hypothetical protein